jgi:hypothetical protein
MLREGCEYEADPIQFVGVYNEFFIVGEISVWDVAAVPKTLLGPLKHLVAGAVRRHLPLELREVEKDIAEQSPHTLLVPLQ